MQNAALKSIKYDSIKSIFTSITNSDGITRAKISQKTGLSIVTIGKIADALTELGVLEEVKEIRAQAGRRAGLLSVNKAKFALILDITSLDFKFSIVDLCMSQIKNVDFRYLNTITYLENINTFFTEAARYVKKGYDFSDCIGIAVSVPGTYDGDNDTVRYPKIPEIVTLPVRATAERIFKDSIIYIDSQTNAAAKSNVSDIDGYKNKSITYFYVSEKNVCGAHIINGELMSGCGNLTCDFGRISLELGITLEERISVCKTDADCAMILSGVICNLIRILNPHAFVMEYETNFPSDNLNEQIKSLLLGKYRITSSHLPKFYSATSGIRNSHRGLVMSLCDTWLRSLIFGDQGI